MSSVPTTPQPISDDRLAELQREWSADPDILGSVDSDYHLIVDLIHELKRERERVLHFRAILKREGWDGPALDDLDES